MTTETIYRLIMPASAWFYVIPLVAIGVLLQVAKFIGVLPDLDVELYAHLISASYVASILIEARQIYGGKAGKH